MVLGGVPYEEEDCTEEASWGDPRKESIWGRSRKRFVQSRTRSNTSQADAPASDGHIPRGPTLVQGAACRHTAPPTCTHNHATQCTATRHTRWHCRMHSITCTKCRTRSLPHVRDVRIHAAAQQRAREVGQRLVTRHRRTSLMRDISLTGHSV